MIPNRTEIQLRDGSAQMRKWRIMRMAFRLFQSLFGNINSMPTYGTGTISIDSTNLSAIDYNDMTLFPRSPSSGLPLLLTKTGQTLPQSLNFDHDTSCRYVITSLHPVPFNLLATIMEVEVGDVSGAGS